MMLRLRIINARIVNTVYSRKIVSSAHLKKPTSENSNQSETLVHYGVENNWWIKRTSCSLELTQTNTNECLAQLVSFATTTVFILSLFTIDILSLIDTIKVRWCLSSKLVDQFN